MKFLKFKHIAGIAAVAAMATALTACDDDDATVLTEAIYPSEVQLALPAEVQQFVYVDETETQVLPMVKGSTLKLSATLLPENVTYKDLKWESSNKEVATVDADGNVTALSGAGAGFSVVMVTPDPYRSGSGVSASLKVVVSEVLKPATRIEILSDANEVYAGETLELTAVVTPEDATYRTVKWTSSDESVATVDLNGVVTGVQNPQAQAEVTITATALDGSGVTATKKIYVNQVVAPEDVTIDPKFSKDNFLCVIGDGYVTLEYTTVPAFATRSMLRWESSDPELATVENGVVTFNKEGNFGDFTIKATCPESGKSSEITMHIEAGLIRELFRDEKLYTWDVSDGKEPAGEWHYGYMTFTAPSDGSKCRRDIKFTGGKAFVHAGDYPIFAVKIDDTLDREEVTKRNIKFDCRATAGDKEYSDLVGGGDNRWAHDYKCSDGSHVFVYDFSTQSIKNGGMLPDNMVATFTTFQLKYADMVTTLPSLEYNLYWVQTFKSLEDVEKYITEQDGLTFEKKK